AAAIILVAVALGIIVYTVLPPHQSKPPIAQLSTEPSKNAEPAIAETTELAEARSYKAPAETLAKKGAVDVARNLNEPAQGVVGQKLENSIFAFRTQTDQPVSAGDMMVITVTADDVKSANEAVVSYLALNNINYTQKAEDFLQDGLASMAGRRLHGGVAAPGGPGGAGGAAGNGSIAGAIAPDPGSPAQVPALRANEDQVDKREDSVDRKAADPLRVESKTGLKVAAQV